MFAGGPGPRPGRENANIMITKFIPGEDRFSERTLGDENSTCPFRLRRLRLRLLTTGEVKRLAI